MCQFLQDHSNENLHYQVILALTYLYNRAIILSDRLRVKKFQDNLKDNKLLAIELLKIYQL